MTPNMYHGGQIHKTGESVEETPLDVVGIDWLRMTGLYADWQEKADGLLREVCEGNPVNSGGLHGFRGSVKWPNGVRLFFGHATSAGMVEIPGAACSTLGTETVKRIGIDLLLGGRCTRIDIARDMRAVDGQRLTLLDDVWQSCERGELCGAKSYENHERRDAMTHDRLGQGVYLGSRKSERFVRVYDKGLETTTCDSCKWIRWEAQLQGDHASQAAMSVLMPTEFGPAALGIAHGFIDFRENTGDPNLSRRPRMAFYQRLLSTVECVRTRGVERGKDFERWLVAFQTQYGGMISAIAKHSGRSIEAVAALLLGGVTPSESAERNPVLFQAVEEFLNLETRIGLTA